MRKFFPLKLVTGFCLLALSFGCAAEKRAPDTKDVDSVELTTEIEPGLAPSSTVNYISAGNAKIYGTFYQAKEEKSPAVLLLHQWQSDRKSYDAFARMLQEKGLGVLAIDGRGFGESVVTTDGRNLKPERSDESVEAMKTDVDNAFLMLAKLTNVDPDRMGIVGASYGSSLAMIYGAGNKDVKAVALLSPGTNYFGNMPTEPAIKAYGDRPLLLVAAKDDKESADAVAKLTEAGGDNKYETKIYDKGGHGTNLFEAKVGLEDLLTVFLQKSLK